MVNRQRQAVEKEPTTPLEKEPTTPKDFRLVLLALKAKRLKTGNSQESGINDLAQSRQDVFDIGDESVLESALSVLSETSQNRELVLKQIDDALERIADGTFGICMGEDCGKKIPLARLRTFPYTPCCVECQTGIERGRVRLRNDVNTLMELPPDEEADAVAIDGIQDLKL